MTKRRVLVVLAGSLFLGALLYVAVWPFVVGGSNMQAFCRALTKDATISQVRDIVQQNGYRMTPPDKVGRIFIHDPRSFGRFICDAQFKDGRLVSARYSQND
jgi:hypothetical protein